VLTLDPSTSCNRRHHARHEWTRACQVHFAKAPGNESAVHVRVHRNAIVHNGTLDAGITLLKPFTLPALKATVRSIRPRTGQSFRQDRQCKLNADRRAIVTRPALWKYRCDTVRSVKMIGVQAKPKT
jgi:hypothetical protein